jgi:hypothetical protein
MTHGVRCRPAQRVALASLVIVAPLRPAAADAVRLLVGGGNLFGQGWMFLDTDGHCKVATAAHVVRNLGGHIRAVQVVDAFGRDRPADAPLVLDADFDVAVLPVPSADDPAVCGTGRLSAVGAARRAAEMTGAEIVTTGQSEIVSIPVARRASAMDAAGGGTFSVRPSLPGDLISKGWSGSVVRDADGPIGIVIEVSGDQTEARAVRVDVIRRLMAAAAPAHRADPSAPSGPPPAMASLAGDTLDPASGPQQSLAGSGAAWVVRPSHRVAVLTATFALPRQISVVALGTGNLPPNAVTSLDVDTRAAPSEADWTDAIYCQAREGAALKCRFLARTVRVVRLVIRTASDAPISIVGLDIR